MSGHGGRVGMDEIAESLFGIERELAAGDGDAYRRHLTPDAVVVVPGARMSAEQTVAAMDASPGWDEFELSEQAVRLVGDGVAVIDYRFQGRRGEGRYEAMLTSVYVRGEAGWKLAHHQQTPIESDG